MARKTRVVGFSVPPAVADEYERLAKREGRSKSELFREMIAAYKVKREEEEFLRLQARMSKRARARGVLTEKDVERLVVDDR
jgi:metal-responsive CopG/Arc/MetJ family transcriptional regulator